VSYEIHVPRKISLDLSANNGGISIENVDGRMEFETTNGGVSLTGVSRERARIDVQRRPRRRPDG
jgi:DUF4097 and DUF4098 domain-containing protein YvlB